MNSVSPKKAKAEETGSGSSSPVLSSVKSPDEMPSLQKGEGSGSPAAKQCVTFMENRQGGLETGKPKVALVKRDSKGKSDWTRGTLAGLIQQGLLRERMRGVILNKWVCSQ